MKLFSITTEVNYKRETENLGINNFVDDHWRSKVKDTSNTTNGSNKRVIIKKIDFKETETMRFMFFQSF